MKIRSVGAELFHVDRRTDKWTHTHTYTPHTHIHTTQHTDTHTIHRHTHIHTEANRGTNVTNLINLANSSKIY